MAFIPTPDSARLVVQWARGSETWSYVLYATLPGFNFADLQGLATAVDAWHTVAHLTLFSTGATYMGTSAYDARTSDGEIALSNANTRPGGNASEIAPINTAICVTLRSNGRGRSARGRKYITGWGEGGLVNGEYSQLYRDSALAYVTGLHTSILGEGWVHVIRSIQQDKVKLTIANTRAVVDMEVRNGKVATQRRRVDRP